MIVYYRDLEIALNSKSYLDHVFNGIIIKRKWWIMPVIFSILYIFMNYLDISANSSYPFNLAIYIIYPFLLYFIFAMLLGLIERKILNNFGDKSKEEKIKVLKRFFFVSGIFTLFAFTLLIDYGYLLDAPYITTGKTVSILINLAVTFLFVIFFNSYKREYSKIEKNILFKNDNIQ